MPPYELPWHQVVFLSLEEEVDPGAPTTGALGWLLTWEEGYFFLVFWKDTKRETVVPLSLLGVQAKHETPM